MTKNELYASWQRYMHRTDLAADMDLTYIYATQMVEEGLISIPAPDFDAILSTSPRLLLHAGLVYLHELAQDERGLERELQRYNTALTGYALKYSRDNVDPRMTPDWYVTEAT